MCEMLCEYSEVTGYIFMIEIEAREYGPEITAEEREALRERIYMFTDDILIWQEVPVQTCNTVAVHGEKVMELTADLENFFLLIDLTEAGRPKAEIIDCLRKVMGSLTGLRYAAVYTGKNFILNVAAKFVMGRMGFVAYSIHKTKEEALDAINNVRT